MMKKVLSKAMALALALLLVPPFLSAVPEVAGAQPPSPPEPPTKVETAVDEALAKIKPELRGKALAGGEELVHVFVTAAEGTNVGRYMVQSLTRPLAILGEQTTFGKVKAGSLLKLASLEGVTSIQPIVFAKSGEPIPHPSPS